MKCCLAMMYMQHFVKSIHLVDVELCWGLARRGPCDDSYKSKRKLWGREDMAACPTLDGIILPALPSLSEQVGWRVGDVAATNIHTQMHTQMRQGSGHTWHSDNPGALALG